MKKLITLLFVWLGGTSVAVAHGDVVPQGLDTKGLPKLGDEWKTANPYRKASLKIFNRAVEIGSRGYNSNCARCHGLEGISGGLAPDLRELEASDFGDEWFKDRIQNGYSQNGVYKMPPFKDILSQEAAWAIRTYVESRPNLEQLDAVRTAALALRESISSSKDDASLKGVVVALEGLEKQVRTVSGGIRVDTPMGRAAKLLKSKKPDRTAAVALLTEHLER